MRLLFITQKVDERDSALGFVVDWLRFFSVRFEKITAICLEKGDFNPPENVTVLSLGKVKSLKSKITSRLKYVWRFYLALGRARREYDAVFVHMNKEYVVLGGLLWRLFGKKIVFWHNHEKGGFLARVGGILSDRICYTSPYSFFASWRKAVQMPAGVSTEIFVPRSEAKKQAGLILSLGRISPVKNLEVLVEAAKILDRSGTDFHLLVVGSAPTSDAVYEKKIRALAAPLAGAGRISFRGAAPKGDTPALYSAAEIFVNLTGAGAYDKTVIEAALSGAIPVVSSPAFAAILPPELFFKENDAESLAAVLKRVLAMSAGEKDALTKKNRSRAALRESLSKLSDEIYQLFSKLTAKS